MNNWHNSLRKVKNHNKGKSRRKDFLDHWLAEKECAFFQQGVLLKNVRERSNGEGGKRKGLIAKLKCQ
jgi:hypothetical protein